MATYLAVIDMNSPTSIAKNVIKDASRPHVVAECTNEGKSKIIRILGRFTTFKAAQIQFRQYRKLSSLNQ